MLIVYQLLLFIMAGGLITGLVLTTHLHLVVRWFIILAILLCSSRLAVFHLFNAAVLSPDNIPNPIAIFLIWAEGCLYFCSTFALLYLIIRAVAFVPGLHFLHSIPFYTTLIAGLLTSILSLYLGQRQPPVVTQDRTFANLPPALEGMRIVVLGDIHLDQFRRKAWGDRLVARVNALQPDLILLTGDYSDGIPELRIPDLQALGDLRAKIGKFAVTGNHEYYWAPDYFKATLTKLGLTLVDARMVEVIPGLQILGVPDSAQLVRGSNDDLLKALATQCSPEKFSILLSHKPAIATLADTLGIDWQLSGHTHGGQLPGLDWLMARLNGGFVRGLYTLSINGMQLDVINGTAQWDGFPYRLYGNQLNVFTLHAAHE